LNEFDLPLRAKNGREIVPDHRIGIKCAINEAGSLEDFFILFQQLVLSQSLEIRLPRATLVDVQEYIGYVLCKEIVMKYEKGQRNGDVHCDGD
jgi:hypothetical protein